MPAEGFDLLEEVRSKPRFRPPLCTLGLMAGAERRPGRSPMTANLIALFTMVWVKLAGATTFDFNVLPALPVLRVRSRGDGAGSFATSPLPRARTLPRKSIHSS